MITSILWSMQIYRSSLFTLPSKIHKEIYASLGAFLWSGVDVNRHKARIAWEELCVPKNEGGLGFMKSKEWNLAASLRHIWNLCSHKECGEGKGYGP